LELTVVLFVIALMSGVVAISFRPYLAEARLRSSTSMVIAALRYARSYAIAHRTDAAVAFDIAPPRLSVLAPHTDTTGTELETGTDTSADETWSVVTTEAGRYRSLPDGISITIGHPESLDLYSTGDAATDVTGSAATGDGTDQETVTFTALGQAEDFSITLHDENDKQRVILVDAITGQCELLSDTP